MISKQFSKQKESYKNYILASLPEKGQNPVYQKSPQNLKKKKKIKKMGRQRRKTNHKHVCASIFLKKKPLKTSAGSVCV